MTYTWFHWGPPLITDSINEEFRKGLLDRGLKLDNDFRESLAGHLDKEKQYVSDDDRKFFVENMQKHIDDFKRHTEFYLNKIMFTELKLKTLWINFMKKGDFNPPHTHGGDITFVIYLDVPTEIYKQDFKNTDINGGPGSIYFTYGDPANKWSTHIIKFKPKTGDILMFPTNLHHMVAPFKCDVTRISVSGNFEIIK